MKKWKVFIIISLFLLSGSPLVFAQSEDKRGASEQAYEHASDKAIFNRVSDWFATVGKSKKEKILKERNLERERKRAEREAGKAMKKTDEQAAKERKRAEKRIRKRAEEAQESMEGINQRLRSGKQDRGRKR